MFHSIDVLVFFLGSVFMFLGSIGIWRFKDFFMKMQCATLLFIGTILAMISIAFNSTPEIKTKTLLVVALMLITSPVSSHVIALIGYEKKNAQRCENADN